MKKIAAMDADIDEAYNTCLRIKSKEFRTQCVEGFQECKEKMVFILSLLKGKQGRLSNEVIAQLNDLAYKGVKQNRF